MYLDLFNQYIKKLRRSGASNQYIGLCPFHDDSNASLSMDIDRGLWNCKACGEKGNAYQLAERMGHPTPHQFINDSNVTNVTLSDKKKANPMDRRKKHGSPRENCEELNKKFKTNLKNNLDKYPDIWDKELIDRLGIGFDDNNNFTFAYYDSDGKVEGIKVHKKRTYGDASNRWYPSNLIPSYSTDKALYICEGEKDVITLLTYGKQAVSTTTGAMSIPKDIDGNYDVEWIQSFNPILSYDNDEAGNKGSEALAKQLLNPDKSIIQWDSNLPKGFDVTDAFTLDTTASEFYNAVKRAKKLKRTIRRSRIMTGINMLVREVPEQNWIIDKVLPQGCQVVFGGTEGSNKSFFAMQMGMSIANNEKQFLEFDMNVKNQRVLFFDAESGADRLTRRYQAIAGKLDNFGKNGASRFYCSTTLGYDGDIFDFLEQDIKRVKPDIVIVDCLYHILGGKDGSKNHVMLPILQRLTDIRKKYNLTLMLISHFNKGGHEAGLHIDRIQGAGALKNWLEHCMLITYTNVEDTRLFKFDKSRDGQQPKCYYKLDWNYPLLSNSGVIMNHQPLLVSNEKKLKWDTALDRLADKFTRTDFARIVAHEMKYSERTASNWLNHMINSGVIQKIRHNEYIKALDVVSESE